MNSRRIDPAGAAFAVAVPVIGAAIAIVLTAVWIDRLPARIADHWSGGGAPDGFSSPWSNAWFIAVLIVVVGWATGAVAAFARVQLMVRRVMLVVSVLVTGLITTVDAVLLASQLDLADPADARLSAWSIGLGVAIGLVVGLPAAALLRDHRVRVPAMGPPDADLPRADPATLAETLPMSVTVGIGGRVAWGIYGFLAIVAAATCVLVRSPWPLPVYAAGVLLVAAVSRFTVELDASGLRVRCLGAPMIEYAAEEFAGARVRPVEPFADFGGWGLRIKARRRYGVVTRRGPGFTLEAACGDTLTVTTDRAGDFAAAVNTLADGNVGGTDSGRTRE